MILPPLPGFPSHLDSSKLSLPHASLHTAIPLYQSFSNAFPGTKPLLTYVMRNYKYWATEQSKG